MERWLLISRGFQNIGSVKPSKTDTLKSYKRKKDPVKLALKRPDPPNTSTRS